MAKKKKKIKEFMFPLEKQIDAYAEKKGTDEGVMIFIETIPAKRGKHLEYYSRGIGTQSQLIIALVQWIKEAPQHKNAIIEALMHV